MDGWGRSVARMWLFFRCGWRLLMVLGCLASTIAFSANKAASLAAEDVRWLNRVTYGIDSGTLERYRLLGRKRFLEEQLGPNRLQVAADVQGAISGLGISQNSLEPLLVEVAVQNQRIQALPDGELRQQARQAQNQAANQAAAETARRHLLRALWSPGQLQEQMTWFWLNHFNFFQGKGNLRWTLADYEERAIRPHALGRFRDLVMATLTHPAMLVYLDNAQSTGGRLNKNYARELLELHTLGVEGGYTQQDVQKLARVLTGVGMNPGKEPRLKAEWKLLYRHAGAFEFNPARHDFGVKKVLGAQFQGEGFAEVEQLVALLVAHPATARFVSRKLAAYWMGDEPPQALVDSMAREFRRTQGDIPAVLRVLFASRAFTDSLGHAFKDPMHFVLSALRLAYDGTRPLNMKPVINWLNALGEPLFGHGSLMIAKWPS